MSDMLPLATYNLNVEPYTPTPAIDVTMPVTVRITMAAINPESYDKDEKPSTLRIVKRNPDFNDHDDIDDIINGDYDEEEMDSEDDVEEEEEETKPNKKNNKKEGKKAGKKSKDEKSSSESSESDLEEEEEELDDEFEEYILVTLSPKGQFQQAIDITIAPEEDIQFVVTGSYAITLSGNYVKHPFDTPVEHFGIDGDEGYDEDHDEIDPYDEDQDEDFSSAEGESDEDDELDDLEEEEVRIEEVIEEPEEKTNKKHNEKEDKKNNKRKQQVEEEKKESKKAKKVEFKKDLEEGPTKKADKKKEEPKKAKAKVLEGGVVIEDRKIGQGPKAKKSNRIGMRYIGKLKNGKVFDKNTSGKPFVFKLGHGEVIKGWDIGVQGMAVGGERRIVIPSAYAYGKQALPGIPANSELTFDVKLVSMK
ncbi:hypothetical protein TBLA_0B06250 [Henningerozyma blattae CBS 6284]|uniref:FK506-binding protein n=1 Tax=Henningerozyma blattae (strain ATCC 34711 / CBS 6284 / DSM 70876 / NBRC 10599 / NRRL Y-10934 / UCD 77-7) TaxID=1071380 RepID=I2GZ98_HENB6|nr:hypothetical protein TBLA_0B06250 [Tetrapisispora blattae CBS 6284]CCH59450.1 hypothetical protein TBLA_0B06250 [Tetrapisispora blattae CBS 6284]